MEIAVHVHYIYSSCHDITVVCETVILSDPAALFMQFNLWFPAMKCDNEDCNREHPLTPEIAYAYFQSYCRKPVKCQTIMNDHRQSQCPGTLWVKHTETIYWFFHDVLRLI